MKALHQGLEALKESRTDDAVRAFDKSIKLKAQFGTAYFFRGKAWNRKGDMDKAIHDYTQAIHLDAAGQVLLERGRLYSQKGESDKAVADFSEYIKRLPWLEAGWEARALEWMKMF